MANATVIEAQLMVLFEPLLAVWCFLVRLLFFSRLLNGKNSVAKHKPNHRLPPSGHAVSWLGRRAGLELFGGAHHLRPSTSNQHQDLAPIRGLQHPFPPTDVWTPVWGGWCHRGIPSPRLSHVKSKLQRLCTFHTYAFFNIYFLITNYSQFKKNDLPWCGLYLQLYLWSR